MMHRRRAFEEVKSELVLTQSKFFVDYEEIGTKRKQKFPCRRAVKEITRKTVVPDKVLKRRGSGKPKIKVCRYMKRKDHNIHYICY